MTKSTKARNQNRGAMIRISTIATAKCTRQCASSGSAHPVFWSLPSAIQEVCNTKSAMTCLTVRTSIHPIRTPTGTDDDMAGKTKADALCLEIDLDEENRLRRSARIHSTRTIQPRWIIYDIS